MARGKRAQVLTAEEKFKQALVPESEQPYKVPENWVWTRIQFCTYVFSGKSPKYVKEANKNIIIGQQANQEYGIDLRYTKYCTDAFWESMPEEYFLKPNDVLLNTLGTGTIGRSGIFTDPNTKILTDGHLFIFRVYLNCLPRIIFYYLKYNQQHIIDSANGSTNQKFLSLTKLCQDAIPIPPLAEQRRIVARIESLFEKLDHARELVQSALDSFKNRKSAILHKAFAGELTAKWREKNGVELESWVEKRLGDCGLLERGRSKHRPRNASELFGGPYPFIQTGDVANADVYITKHNQTLSEIGLNQSKLFPKGTLCITIAANIGDVAILSYDSCFPDSVVGFTPNEYTNSKFVYYLMNILQKQLEAEAPATAQKNINLKVLNEITFRCPRIIEQQEIVRILDNLLEKEQQTQEQLEPILDQIDMMKKSILARAFRGELGTNDPSEESAMEFLKEILVKGNQS